jgi:predicted DNA-binding mobile mystery protein A
MDPRFREMRRRQITRSIAPFYRAKCVRRPVRGWLKAIREAAGFSLKEIASKLGTTVPSVFLLERSEAKNSITLKKLSEVAEAMECILVYAIVPKTGSLDQLAERRIQNKLFPHAKAVEHTMALEDQAVGKIEKLFEGEIRSRIKKTRRVE